MTVREVSRCTACVWFRQVIGGALPPALVWYRVSGLEYTPTRRGWLVYLVAGNDGMQGLIGVRHADAT